MTRIYLLRHGETAWNARGNRYCGRTDLPLSPIGLTQSAAAARAFAEVPLAAIYVSNLCRSHETGALLAEAQSVPLITDPRLIEIDFGVWEGLTATEITTVDPLGRAAWLDDPTATRAGGTGETGWEVSERMHQGLSDIASAHPGAAVAVVGHNTANRLFLAASVGAPLARYRQFTLGNASISTCELENGEARWLHINVVSHLNARCR